MVRRKKSKLPEQHSTPTATLESVERKAAPGDLPVSEMVRFHVTVVAMRAMSLGQGFPSGYAWHDSMCELYEDTEKLNKCTMALTCGSMPVPRFARPRLSLRAVPGGLENSYPLITECMAVEVVSKMIEDTMSFFEVPRFIPVELQPETDADRQLMEFSGKLEEVDLVWSAAFESFRDATAKFIDPTEPDAAQKLLCLGKSHGIEGLVKALGAGVPVDDLLTGLGGYK